MFFPLALKPMGFHSECDWANIDEIEKNNIKYKMFNFSDIRFFYKILNKYKQRNVKNT